MWTPGSLPRLGRAWRVRNDGDYVVAYLSDTAELTFRVLTPLEAILVPFLDGRTPLAELEEIFLGVLAARDPALRERISLRQVLEPLTGAAGLVGFDGAPSASLATDPGRLVPDFRHYRLDPPRLDRPLVVNLALTERCQTDCAYCYSERIDPGELPTDRLIDIFDELAENEVFIVDVLGGDLFTRPDAIALLQAMVERDFVFFLSTKALITGRTAAALAELGIGIDNPEPHLRRDLQLSIDSADPLVAGSLVGRRGFLERVTQSARNLVAAGARPRIKCVLTARNHDAPEGLVRHFSELGLTRFEFVQYGRSHYRHDDDLFLTREQKASLRSRLARLQERNPDLVIRYKDDGDEPPASQKTWEQWDARSLCSGGRVSMLIKANGDVTLCDQLPHSTDHVVGSVLEDGVLRVWRSERLQRFLAPGRASFEGTPCFACDHFDSCMGAPGYCYRDSLFSYGTLYDAPPDCPAQTKGAPREA